MTEIEWQEHIRNFFNSKLPGNESNFNFTEILSNFPFMIEWVIQNKPKNPLKLESLYFWPYFDSRHGMHSIEYTGYDLDYISAVAPHEIILKYPTFEWNYSVLKFRFPEIYNNMENINPITQKNFDDILEPPEFVCGGLSIIGKPGIDTYNGTIETKYIPALLESRGEIDYFNKEPLDNLYKENKDILTSVVLTDRGYTEYRELKDPNKIDIRLFSKKIWKYCSFSPKISWEFIKNNRGLPWDWNLVFRSRRFKPEFFMYDEEGKNENWNGYVISGLRNMTFEFIEYLEKEKYELDWTTISYCDFEEEKKRFFN